MHQLSREERLLPLKTACNVRDLGGYETQEGYYTKSHRFIRAGNLSNLSREDMSYLHEYGLKVVVDLRSEYECNKRKDPYENNPSVEYYHVDLFRDPTALLKPGDMNFKDMGDLYILMLDNLKGAMKQVFEIFLDHPYDCILFHCSAGKDRTGVIAGLLLELTGCYDYDIVKDYAESFENNLGVYNELKKMTSNEADLLSSPTFMMKMLYHLRENYGSSYAYLQECGMSQEDVDDLKNTFIF